MALAFDTRFDPAYGTPVEVAPGVARLTARNPGPFTFHGTNTYLIGKKSLAVLDPGPDDDAHLADLLSAIGGRPVSHILISHTHRDHSPLAARLKQATGAPTASEGPHRPARPMQVGEADRLDASADTAFVPDIVLGDGAIVEGDGWRVTTVLTPGHAANHAAYSLDGTGILFSADHVMGWSTSIVAPPDGSMADYMASLDKLIARGDRLLLPGHGGAVTDPSTYLPALKEHRLARERAILERIRQGDRSIAAMVLAVYRDIDPRLHGAAALSVLAHIEDLVARGLVEADGPPSLDARYSVP